MTGTAWASKTFQERFPRPALESINPRAASWFSECLAYGWCLVNAYVLSGPPTAWLAHGRSLRKEGHQGRPTGGVPGSRNRRLLQATRRAAGLSSAIDAT